MLFYAKLIQLPVRRSPPQADEGGSYEEQQLEYERRMMKREERNCAIFISMDDDISVSQSSAEFLESPHKARMKELKRKLEEKGIAVQGDQQHDLKALKLALLRGQVDKVRDDAKARSDTEAQAKGTAQGTKTREQEMKESTLNADTTVSTDQAVKQSKQEEKAVEELKKDEIQSEDS